MRISDWSSDVCSSDLVQSSKDNAAYFSISSTMRGDVGALGASQENLAVIGSSVAVARKGAEQIMDLSQQILERAAFAERSEEHTSELQSLMRISYAVFGLKQKK